MALWCEKMPVVDAPQSDKAKPVTLIYPYYRNAQFLRTQLSWWRTFPEHIRKHLNAIIVDDGSPDPAFDVLKNCAHPFPIRLFRIAVDVRWNWLAARNIGFRHASEGWCLVTDMDHVVPESTATAVVYGYHDPEVIYGFSRREYTGVTVAPHPNSWLMTRKMFWRVGGYDERMSGIYGTDGIWRRRMASVAPIHILRDRLIRHEYQQDSSTTAYLRKQPEDARLKALIASFPKNSRPTHLTFPYHEVTL